MSAAILDRARAFEMIASHLPEKTRTDIAEAIGAKLLAEVGPAPKPNAASTPTAEPVPERAPDEHDAVVAFLTSHGWSGVELVRASVRMAAFLKQHKELTPEAGMRVWLHQEETR